VIVGVSIGENAGDRMAPRWQRRRLRAAQHQGANRPEARGLAEWCSMKLPRALRGYRIAADLSAATVAAGAAAGYNLADAIDRAVYADFLDEQGQDGESVRQTLRHG
jgi:uncharacterized protein (TIGR02996 family)